MKKSAIMKGRFEVLTPEEMKNVNGGTKYIEYIDKDGHIIRIPV